MDAQNPSSPSIRRRSTSHKSPEVVAAGMKLAKELSGSVRFSTHPPMKIAGLIFFRNNMCYFWSHVRARLAHNRRHYCTSFHFIHRSHTPCFLLEMLDDLRPDWNRRILAAAQRQPGSRRASTSSSMSNSTFALGRRLAGGRQGSSSRRSNSTAAAQDYNGYLSAMRNMGTDLEELMIMEAMRQSLQDEEERVAREAAAAATAAAGGGSNATTAGETGEGSATGSSPSSPTQQNYGRGQGGRGSARVRGSPATGHSRSSTQSSTANGGSAMPALVLSRSDNGSLESLSDGGVRHDDDSDSDQEDSPALLDNRAIRYAQVNLGDTSGATTAGGGREGSDIPKHHRRAGTGSRNAPEAV